VTELSWLALGVVVVGVLYFAHEWWKRRHTPIYCPDCGEPIRISRQVTYDPKTGDPRDWMYWHCQRVGVTFFANGGHETRWHGAKPHVWGFGRPSWHADAVVEYKDGSVYVHRSTVKPEPEIGTQQPPVIGV
jgi:hypothetical protein